MLLGRHTCLSWLHAGRGLSSVPLLAEAGGAPPHVIAVGDRRRVARVLARLEEPLDLAEHCRETIGERAAGRVALGVGRVGTAAVLAVETQMGGPPTEIILHEVLDESFYTRGARSVIRVGTCGTLAEGGVAPALVIAAFATGWSAAVEQRERGVLGPPAEFDPQRPARPPAISCTDSVVAALRAAAPQAAVSGVFSKDSLYAEQDERFAEILRELGCVATEMELATLGPIALSKGVAWGGIMATAGRLDREAWLDAEETERNEDAAIHAALEAVRTLSSEA
ncbi:MAG: phosphorylase family protein [Planctomycetota bacterium]|jgi:uridine phosphorylase